MSPTTLAPGRTPRTRPAPSSRRTGAVLGALVAGVAFVVVHLVAVRTRSGQTLDTDLMHTLGAAIAQPGWSASVLDLVGPLTVLAATACLVLAALAGRGTGDAGVVVATVLGTVAVAAVLKTVLARPTLTDMAENSLPSGHVAAVAGLAVAAYLIGGRALRPLLLVVGGGAVAATGAATITWGWHRPSDVMAAVLVALTVGATARAFVPEPTR